MAEEQTHRAAICLNNIGCSLLERKCYRQALETLQSAVVAMKSSCRGSSVPLPIGDSKIAEGSLDSLIKAASQRLYKPEPTSASSHLVTAESLSDDAFESDIDMALGVCPFKTSVVFPVRIDSFDLDSDDEKEASLTCTIILHNFGLASLLRSTVVEAEGAQRLHQNCFKIFRLCQTVLSSRITSCPDHLQLKKLFFLGYVVVSASVHALRAAGRQKEALESMAKLVRLKAGAVELGKTDIIAHRSKTAAAA